MAKVFISYSSKDVNVANMAVALLEERDHRCWIAPRDIRPGQEWAEAIVEGIRASEVFVLIFSQNANASPQILREVERAVNAGIPIIPFRIEDVGPEGSLEYFMSVPHWLDAMSGPVEDHIDKLAAVIEQIESGDTLPPGGALGAMRRGDTKAAMKIATRGALGGLGLAALVGTAIFAGLGPPSAGLAWFGAALAFALPLAAVTLGIAQTWRIVAARWALIAGSLGALGFYLWARGAFIIEGLNGDAIVRGHTCTEDAAFIYEDLCPDLPSDALMDAAYEVDLLWTPGSIAQAAQMIGAGWILTIVCAGALLGGFLTLLAARRKRGH